MPYRSAKPTCCADGVPYALRAHGAVFAQGGRRHPLAKPRASTARSIDPRTTSPLDEDTILETAEDGPGGHRRRGEPIRVAALAAISIIAGERLRRALEGADHEI